MRVLIFIFLITPIVSCLSTNIDFEITVDSIEYFNYSNYPEVNQYSVNVKFNDDYTSRFEQVTSNNIGKELSVTLGTQTLVTAKIQCKIPSGNFSISKFDSPEDSKEFMQILLKDQYSSKLYKPKPEDFKSKLSYNDSLYLQSSMDFVNFDFQASSSKLTELSKLTSPDSKEYTKILVSLLMMSLRANKYKEAQQYFDELNILTDSLNANGSGIYKRDGIFDILLLLGNNKTNEAKKLKIKFEEEIDFPKIFEVLRSLPYSSNDNNRLEKDQQEIDISKVFEVLASLPYYSYICYKFGDYEEANTNITEYINVFSKTSPMKDNSYYLLQLMYLCSDKLFKEALELSEQILDKDVNDFIYDTIQSKLWHSIILFNNNRNNEALDYYIKAKNEFDAIDNPENLTLKFLLTPFVGAFPNDEINQDFDKIEGLSNE